MIHTIDTTKLTMGGLEALAKFYDAKQAEAMHLSGAAPTIEDLRRLEDTAEAASGCAAELRAEAARRLAKFRGRQSTDEAWRECFAAFNALAIETRGLIRNGARATLGGSGEIGTSDVNHAIFALWQRNERNFTNVLSELVG